MASTSLTFTVTKDEGAEPRTATLECPGGDTAACEALEKVERTTFDPVPKDQACTMILGGPETATVTGRLDGSSLEASFSQQNGCEIARWKQITPVLEALDLL